MNIEKLKFDIKMEPNLEGPIPTGVIKEGLRAAKINPILSTILLHYTKFHRLCELLARSGVLSERISVLEKIKEYEDA